MAPVAVVSVDYPGISGPASTDRGILFEKRHQPTPPSVTLNSNNNQSMSMELTPDTELMNHIRNAQQIVDACRYKNGKVMQNTPWRHFVFQIPSNAVPAISHIDLVVWVPEVLFNAAGVKYMPCPNCGNSKKNVQTRGWGERCWASYKFGKKVQCIISKEYCCTKCEIVFRGYHPKSAENLAANANAFYPLPSKLIDEELYRVLGATSKLEKSVPAQMGTFLPLPSSCSPPTLERSLSLTSLPALPAVKSGSEFFDGDLFENFRDLVDVPSTSTNQGFDILCGEADEAKEMNFPESEIDFDMSCQTLDDDNLIFSMSDILSNSASNSNGTSSFKHIKGYNNIEDLIEVEQTLDRTVKIEHQGSTPPEMIVCDLQAKHPELFENVGEDASDSTMAAASLAESKRSIQFCSVCFGVRRNKGKLVQGHRGDGYCPIKGRRATAEEKRELRRRRQKMRRAMNKRKGSLMSLDSAASVSP